MTALDILIKLIKESEGCKLTAYYCPAGVITIGYGHTGHDVCKGLTWTQANADEILAIDAQKAIDQALKLSPILAHEPNKLGSIADFIFNLGAGNYQSSTLKKSVDTGNWPDAQKQIKRWNKARVNGELTVLAGLTRRREAEAKLLSQNDH